MTITIGTAQTILAPTANNTTSSQNYYFTKFVSTPINQTSVAANTWTYNFAARTNVAGFTNYPVSGTNQPVRIHVYVWRPSTSTKVGTILDGNTASTVDEQATADLRVCQATFSGAVVNSTQADDVIVCEIWFVTAQQFGSTNAMEYAYDGTTANTTKNAIVTNHASFLETPENISFVGGTTTVSQTTIHKYDIDKYITQTSIQKYSLRQYLTQTSIHKYTLRTILAQLSIQKYNLKQYLAQTSIQKYSLKQLIASISIQKYNLLKFLSQTSIQKYDLRKLVAATTNIHKYSLRQYLVQTSIQKYRMGGIVLAASIQKYNLRKYLSQTSIQKYYILKFVAITASIQKYAILKAVIQATIQKYNTRKYILQASIQKYNLGSVLLQISKQKYNILRFVAVLANIQKYAIRKNVTATPNIQKYGIRQYVIQTTIHKYNNAGGVLPPIDMTQTNTKTYANKFIVKV